MGCDRLAGALASRDAPFDTRRVTVPVRPQPLPVTTVTLLQPLVWLERAWHDIRAVPGPSVAHGVALTLAGWALIGLAGQRFWVLAGALSGFLLIAPVLATGLYTLSQALERGEPAGWSTVWAVWRSADRRLVAFGSLLALAGAGWVVVSAALITLFASAPVAGPVEFLGSVLLGLVLVVPMLGHASWYAYRDLVDRG